MRRTDRRDPLAELPPRVRYAFGAAMIGMLALGLALSGAS
jgi:hypothetical protein